MNAKVLSPVIKKLTPILISVISKKGLSMFSKLISKIAIKIIKKKVNKSLKEGNFPDVDLNKIILGISLKINNAPDGVPIEEAEKLISNLLNNKVEPMFKGVLDFQVDFIK